jgi:hypothetical protein
MQDSKNNNSTLILTAFFLLLSACTTTSYRIKQDNGRTELTITPERILLECEYIKNYSGDIKDAYGFMMHILDEENTVLNVTQTNVLNKKDCFERIQKIGKILRGGRIITVGAFGEMKEPRTQVASLTYTFPSLGKYQFNGHDLKFGTIWNENNQCYDAQFATQKPCPRDEFPIHQK